jgi:biofilm PGA synthesis N-glycosyltransferase PgaC
MTAAFALILSLYCLLILSFLYGWIRVRRQTMPLRGRTLPGISVVVAVRNEENNIHRLLHDLSCIAYPPGKFEVIVVNDHSIDGTAEKAAGRLEEFPMGKLIELPVGKMGKKEALTFGIENARYEIIATTDADCRFSKNWLTCISHLFESEETKMVAGAVKLSGDRSLFTRMQTTDFFALIGSAAAAIGLGYPVMCNGANLAFRKSAFLEVKGYKGNFNVASGDDEFLMRKVFAAYPKGIKFLNYYEAVVTTRPQKTLREFVQQRLRWAGKWKFNTDIWTQMLAVFILLSHVSFAGLVIHNLTAPDDTAWLLASKTFLEGVFIFWISRFLERKFDILAFILLQVVYPFYVLSIGVLSLYSGYEWKARNYK